MSYIINEAGDPIASTTTRIRSGRIVRCAYQRTTDGVLVNAFEAKVSNAKKWAHWEIRNCTILPVAEITDLGELYIPGY